jgi:hypothetical protein
MLDFAFVAASPGNRKRPWLPLTLYYAGNTQKDHSASKPPAAAIFACAITCFTFVLATWLASCKDVGNTQLWRAMLRGAFRSHTLP